MPEFGLIHYNYPGTLEEFLTFAQEEGFQCTELLHTDVWNYRKGESFEVALERAPKLRRLLDEKGIRVSAVAPGNDFIHKDEVAVKEQVERMKKFSRLAEILGTRLLRIDGGAPKPDMPEDRTLYVDLIAKGLELCRPFIEKEGFYFALDNHGLVTNDADLQVEILERVGSKNIGANLDTMNYRWAGHDLTTVAGFYEKIAPYVRHTHFKDGRGKRGEYQGTALGEGEIPLERAVQCLKAAGYSGPWLVEYEGKTEHQAGFRKGLQWLKAHV